MTVSQIGFPTVKRRIPPKRKRITKLPEVRREELLEAASALFLEKGIAATGVGDITDRAKVARGTFYLFSHPKTPSCPCSGSGMWTASFSLPKKCQTALMRIIQTQLSFWN